MQLGIIGLPNVGKSTVFNAVTKAGAPAENYPFCTIDPNVGVVAVPDKRLDRLAEIFDPKKVTPATIEFVDIAGLVKGASRGEGLGNKFLANIRNVDAIVHVVRCFDDPDVTHVDGTIDPVRDAQIINLELILADLQSVESQVEKLAKQARFANDAELTAKVNLMRRIQKSLEAEIPVRNMELTDDERALIPGFFMLTSKPIIYVANISEDDLGGNLWELPRVKALKEMAEAEGAEVVPICCKVEEELSELDEEDKKVFLEEMGLESSALDGLVAAGYKLLGLISFLTGGRDEVRAWTIHNGDKAPQAAGKIHSDFERGFIAAEVVPFTTLSELGSMQKAKEQGLVRSEGKGYVMKDGDVVLFRFNV